MVFTTQLPTQPDLLQTQIFFIPYSLGLAMEVKTTVTFLSKTERNIVLCSEFVFDVEYQ